MNSAQTTYSYFTGTNRLQSLTGARGKSYNYDAAGNMTSDGVATWTFAGDNRPSQVVVGALSVQFDINALGQRARKSSSAGITRFMYDEAGHQIGEYADDGTLVEETAWLGDLPVAVIRPDATGLYYVHPDHLGTPRMITRPSDNAIVWRWDNTEAFGDSQPNQDPSGLGTFTYNLRLPGQYYDGETGTNYNYFRDYDPGIGRYVESDPIGLRGGPNTFAYVLDSPLNLVDPKGLVPSTGPMPNSQSLKSCPDPCAVLEGSITETLTALKRAWVKMYYDPEDLWNRAWGSKIPGQEGLGSWLGHKKNFHNLRNQLRNQIRLAQQFNCKVDDEALSWATSEPPLSPQTPDPGWMPPF